MKPEYIGINNFDTTEYVYAYCKCPLPVDYAIKWPLIKDGKPHTYACTCENCGTEVAVIAKSYDPEVYREIKCEDCISRRDAVNACWNGWGHDNETIKHIERNILKLPPVTPVEKWIPVSEKLPEENKTVMASTKYGVYPEAKYTKRYGWEWAYEAGCDYWEGIKEIVTAWMPLPEKYEPESEDKE